MPFYQTALLDQLAPAARQDDAARIELISAEGPAVGIIVNPHARANRMQPERIGALVRLLGERALVRVTSKVDELPGALEELTQEGVRLIVADGGDGSLHQLLRAMTALRSRPDQRALGRPLPAILPGGSGSINVVANAVGLPTGELELYSRLRHAIVQGHPLALRTVDTMAVELERQRDGARERISTPAFVSAVGGVGQRFFDVLEESPQRTPAEVARILGRSALSWLVNRSGLERWASAELRDLERRIFRPTPARVLIDGQALRARAFTGINIASVPVRFGAAMKVFGRASQPGRLNALCGDASPSSLIANIPRGVVGLAPRDARITDALCHEMRVEAGSAEMLAPIIDGDRYSDVTSATFRVGTPIEVPQL